MTGVKQKKERSPAYPFIALDAAVLRLEEFEKTFGRHSAPAAKSGLAWKMKEKSSQAYQTLAALKAFGFVEYSGSGDDREAKLTDNARNYLRAQQDDIKRNILKSCALKPKAIAKYWEDWGHDRPPSPVCLDQLVLKDGFTEKAADIFLKVYDKTIAYAGLANSDKIDEFEEEGLNVEVGDFIQWETDGILRLDEPKKVRAIQEHEDDSWVFIEGSEAGIPMGQVNVEQKGQGSPDPAGKAPPLLPELTTGNTDMMLQTSEREWLRGPLSKESGYRIIVSGDLGPKEIGKLIRLLEAQKDVLSDDDE